MLPLGASQKAKALGAIVGIAEHGGDRKAKDADDQQVGASTRQAGLKSSRCHGHAIGVTGLPDAGNQNDQGSGCANEQGVYDWPPGSNQAFADGFPRSGRTMGHGFCAYASFI